MSGAAANPDQGTCPALEPPPIVPWNGFDIDSEGDVPEAILLISEIVMDDEWHPKVAVVDEVVYELELPHERVRKLLNQLKAHGDIRQDGDEIRMTTRWKGWAPPPEDDTDDSQTKGAET